MRNTLAMLVAVTLTLAGCGGGSGGGNVRPVAEPPSSLTASQAQRAAARNALQAARRLARSTPQFGSVTQSTNGSRVSTRFSAGPRLVVDITPTAGGSLSLDTAQHTVDYDAGISQVTGRGFAQALVLKHSASQATIGLIATDWSSTDYTDYLAGGYWLHVTGDIYNGQVSHADMGAFVDGPEIDGTPPLPVIGIATYSGIVAGLYVSRYGTDIPGVPQGTHEIGEFSGDLMLTADFAAEHIFGAVDDIYLTYAGETPTGEIYADEGFSDYRINLGVAPFSSNGTFSSSSVTVTHPLLPATTEGSWGGRFSTRDDGAGNPRLVAGTLGATTTTPGGGTGSLVGAFYGATPQFE